MILIRVIPGSVLPSVIIFNAQLPLDAPAVFGQKMNGPTANAIIYFGITEEAAAMSILPDEEQTPAMRLLNRYWIDAPSGNRQVQETMKMMAYCRNMKEMDGVLVKMFKVTWEQTVILTHEIYSLLYN